MEHKFQKGLILSGPFIILLENYDRQGADISLILHIWASTEEQTTNAKQVSKAIEGINEITRSASSAEEMSASTEELSGRAQELKKLISQFRIRNGKDKL
jgi:methyl-accepting chemotaxis protein